MTARRTADRPKAPAAASLVGLSLAAVAVCCGLPVLLAAGSGVVVLGIGLRSWALVVAGLVAAVAGWVFWRRRRRTCAAPSDRGC